MGCTKLKQYYSTLFFSLSRMLLNVDADAVGRILLLGFKFGTVKPQGYVVPTCTAKGRAGEVQEAVAPRGGATLGTVGYKVPHRCESCTHLGYKDVCCCTHNILRVQLRRRRTMQPTPQTKI
jgi:hypothetical protein